MIPFCGMPSLWPSPSSQDNSSKQWCHSRALRNQRIIREFQTKQAVAARKVRMPEVDWVNAVFVRAPRLAEVHWLAGFTASLLYMWSNSPRRNILPTNLRTDIAELLGNATGD
jgi:hypothetical protein